jgi:hypothetical protein
LTSAICSSFSVVRISDFFLFKRRLYTIYSEVISFIACSISPFWLLIINISSANARRSPLFLNSLSF